MNYPDQNPKALGTADEANRVLDRCIGFISNCDSKASIILAIDSGFLAIVLNNDDLFTSFKTLKINFEFNKIFSLFLPIISIIIILIGVGFILFSLLARIDNRKVIKLGCKKDSIIFFGDIIKNRSYKQYEKSVFQVDTHDYLNDIYSQIYINSHICYNKYKVYNRGTIISLSGILLFIISQLI